MLTLRNTERRYGLVAMTLHWLIAAAIIGMLALGTWMVDLKPGSSLQFEMYQLHKSIGLTILVLSLLRLVWRLSGSVPPLPGNLKPWEAGLARLTHVGFYVLMIGLPLSGWAMVSASPWNFPTVVFGQFTLPHLPVLDSLADKKAAEDLLKEVHELLGNATMLLLALHVAGALKHHLLLRDDTLLRMLPVRPRAERIRRSAPAPTPTRDPR